MPSIAGISGPSPRQRASRSQLAENYPRHLFSSKVVEYTYDVFDRRIGKEVDTTSPFDMADAAIERYVYDDLSGVSSVDGGNVVLDFVDPDGTGSTSIALEQRRLFGNAVDQILAEEDVTVATSSADRVYWPLVDHLGTVRDLVENDGTLGEHFKYDAFGNVTSGNIALTRYLFTSREHDADTGLQYNRARWYDAAVGRWISQDPIGFAAGDANLYRYVGNNVAQRIDSSGLDDDVTVQSVLEHEGVEGNSIGTYFNYFLSVAGNNYASIASSGSQPTFVIPPSSPGMGHTILASRHDEPSTRPLTPGEVQLLQTAFSGHLDTDGLEIGIGGLIHDGQANSMTPNETAWFPDDNYHADFSRLPQNQQGHFVHEMMHVLQSQNGNWNWLDGPGLWWENDFNYRGSYSFDWNDLGNPLWTFNMEQQAKIIEYYHDGTFKGSHKVLAAQTLDGFHTQPPSETSSNGHFWIDAATYGP